MCVSLCVSLFVFCVCIFISTDCLHTNIWSQLSIAVFYCENFFESWPDLGVTSCQDWSGPDAETITAQRAGRGGPWRCSSDVNSSTIYKVNIISTYSDVEKSSPAIICNIVCGFCVVQSKYVTMLLFVSESADSCAGPVVLKRLRHRIGLISDKMFTERPVQGWSGPLFLSFFFTSSFLMVTFIFIYCKISAAAFNCICALDLVKEPSKCDIDFSEPKTTKAEAKERVKNHFTFASSNF